MKAAIALSLVFWLAFGFALVCATCAEALDYELWAERPGALLRADEPNVRRMGQPFPSYHDCILAIVIPGNQPPSGWRLRCRPVQAAPVPRLVGR